MSFTMNTNTKEHRKQQIKNEEILYFVRLFADPKDYSCCLFCLYNKISSEYMYMVLKHGYNYTAQNGLHVISLVSYSIDSYEKFVFLLKRKHNINFTLIITSRQVAFLFLKKIRIYSVLHCICFAVVIMIERYVNS